jgi:hypothetical protein
MTQVPPDKPKQKLPDEYGPIKKAHKCPDGGANPSRHVSKIAGPFLNLSLCFPTAVVGNVCTKKCRLLQTRKPFRNLNPN